MFFRKKNQDIEERHTLRRDTIVLHVINCFIWRGVIDNM